MIKILSDRLLITDVIKVNSILFSFKPFTIISILYDDVSELIVLKWRCLYKNKTI